MAEGNTRVYVGNLGYRVSWQDLKDHFREVGKPTFAEIFMDRDGRSKGCGVLEFQTVEEAQRAVKELTDTKLHGRRESRSFSFRDPQAFRGYRDDAEDQQRRVYVGNLQYSVSWQDLKDHFREVGTPTFVEVFEDQDGQSRGCGVVELKTSEEAQRAIKELTNTRLHGRLIFVREDREHGSLSYRDVVGVGQGAAVAAAAVQKGGVPKVVDGAVAGQHVARARDEVHRRPRPRQLPQWRLWAVGAAGAVGVVVDKAAVDCKPLWVT
eukprot:TRINITY_DN3981_c0_g1_i1.p1 TRINITY_DN3981_c0_g1~~TRINITY_DN3981_c0_g1_i1.p1  ORF type:complete len:266 (-),score=34.92 TRINITY_DN3981_c0_g1_i1:172-969(-)